MASVCLKLDTRLYVKSIKLFGLLSSIVVNNVFIKFLYFLNWKALTSLIDLRKSILLTFISCSTCVL